LSTALQRLPRLRWAAILGTALAVLALTVCSLELRLARQGFQPNLSDSVALWARQRQRADRLGSRALLLVGDSRVLTDLDLGELRRISGLEPVQLGVGEASFLPVLQDLAKDPKVSGTLLVNFEPQELHPVGDDPAAAYEAQYHPSRAGYDWDFADMEATLTDELHVHLRSYADGARPLTSLLMRASGPPARSQYITVLPDREELADFSLVKEPALYYVRAIRDFPTWPVPPEHATLEEVQATIEYALVTLRPADPLAYRSQYSHLAGLVAAIGRHAGRVVFVRLPRCGYLQLIDDRRFPRRSFWDPLQDLPGVQTLNFEDVPALVAFRCPDGSHLDKGDKTAFTRSLADALQLGDGRR